MLGEHNNEEEMQPAQQRFPFDAAFTAICKKEKVSQKAAAKRLGIGASHLSDILAGRKAPQPDECPPFRGGIWA